MVHIKNITSGTRDHENLFDEELLNIPKEVILYEINGPLFFGVARQFQETITIDNQDKKVIIIRARYDGVNMNIADYAHFSEKYEGVNELLDCDYYVLKENFGKLKTNSKM